jgi:hypothetical protein
MVKLQFYYFKLHSAVFRIRFSLGMDPDPAFYLNAAPDPDQKTKSIKNTGSGCAIRIPLQY